MAVSQMWFIICKCLACLFPRDYKADLSASTTVEYFGVVFCLAN